MKIISVFKDYYDYLINKYGIDENIILNRRKLKADEGIQKCKCRKLPFSNWQPYKKDIKFHWLVICGKMYLLIENKYNNESIRLFEEKDLEDKYIYGQFRSIFVRYKNKDDEKKVIMKKNIGVYNEDMINIHKKIKSPIFQIDWVEKRNDTIRLNDGYIILKNIGGIPSLLPADDLYKDLIYFIGNILNNNPDPEKNSSIKNDKIKIIKGGFDIITSFRKM